jgi:hypothetical protein
MTKVSVDQEMGCAEQLGHFFPRAVAVRVPAQIKVARSSGADLRESTVLELADSEHAIFVSTLPLEFNDRIRLHGDSNFVEATVVAVQYHDGRKAVAVKFDPRDGDWVSKL